MSLILESLPGSTLVCLQEFHACPEGVPFSWDQSTVFSIGEEVRFLRARENPRFQGRPNGWSVVFENDAGERFEAVQTYFVTEDAWKKLQEHFEKVQASRS